MFNVDRVMENATARWVGARTAAKLMSEATGREVSTGEVYIEAKRGTIEFRMDSQGRIQVRTVGGKVVRK